MGTGEENSPAKSSKPASSTQEIPTTPPYPDWSSSMQAYYGAGATPPPFFASTVASTPLPYMWGSQHPMISPYGTPVPYPPIYPAGGIFGHPNMATTPTSVQTNADLEVKGPNGKDRTSAKKSKGGSGNTSLVGVRAVETGKVASGSGNDGASQSAESGSDGSSDASDDDTTQREFASNKKGSFDQMLADASVPGKPVVSMPPTNLNMGMDLWNPSSAAAGAAKLRSNPSGGSIAVTPATMIGRESGMPEQWIQDERELKRQKRKQSNRESARRSRLRKQAECEELQARVDSLSNENHTIKDELQRLSEECAKLNSENNAIKEELTQLHGPDALAKLEQKTLRRDDGNS